MLEVFDTVSGVTTGVTDCGTKVHLSDGSKGWIKGKFLRTGINVTCSVLHIKSDGFPILLLDSASYPEELVA